MWRVPLSKLKSISRVDTSAETPSPRALLGAVRIIDAS
jgi:hypothetical protein